MDISEYLKVDEVIALVLAFICSTFCVLATFVLIYYIRRSYCLHLEIKGIDSEKLWYPNFQNHLKNLKIKAMISNFVILIILVEIVNSGAMSYQNILYIANAAKLTSVIKALIHIGVISRLCHFPLLCLFMKVLWLVYLHSPYKYTIMRWAAYIVLRLIVLYTVFIAQKFDYWSENNYIMMAYMLSYGSICILFQTLDLITYMLYSRRFYLHLKSRELEAKLFMDREKYIENKYLRIHFKVATILVVIIMFIYNGVSITSIAFTCFNNLLLILSIETVKTWFISSQLLVDVPLDFFQFIFRVLLSLNYLYVFFVILYKYWKKKHNFDKVNDKIRPLVREYQDQILNWQNS